MCSCLESRAGHKGRGCVVPWASGSWKESDAAKRDWLGRADLVWRRNDDAQPSCARGTRAGIGGFFERYRYGLGTADLGNQRPVPQAVARKGGSSEQGVNHEIEVYGLRASDVFVASPNGGLAALGRLGVAGHEVT